MRKVLAVLAFALVAVFGCEPVEDDSPGHNPKVQIKTVAPCNGTWQECLKPTPDKWNGYGKR